MWDNATLCFPATPAGPRGEDLRQLLHMSRHFKWSDRFYKGREDNSWLVRKGVFKKKKKTKPNLDLLKVL